MTNTVLEIKDLNVEYKTAKINGSKTVKAVNGVSLTINEGEIYAIAGESGCGKSTLAKALMKLININSGTVKVEGISENKNPKDYIFKRAKQQSAI